VVLGGVVSLEGGALLAACSASWPGPSPPQARSSACSRSASASRPSSGRASWRSSWPRSAPPGYRLP